MINQRISNKVCHFFLSSEAESIKFAKQLAGFLSAPLILGFRGEIGMGKTTIIRSLFASMGVTARIKSPTYALVESYHLEKIDLHHFDLYRINDESELDYIGFRDYFAENTICCIEWPDNLGSYELDLDLVFHITRHGEGREVNVIAQSEHGVEVLGAIENKP